MKEKILGKKIRLMSSRGKKHAPIVSEARRRLEGLMEGMSAEGRRTHRGIPPMVTQRGLTGKKGAMEGRMEGMMTGGLRTHRGIIPMKTNGNIKKRTRRSRIIL